MAFSSNFILFIIFSGLIQHSTGRCFSSIIAFGDSLADTGNSILLLSELLSHKLPPAAFLPYGETFFGHPTGRCSDGRLVIDFIAQHLGIPLVPPSGSKDESENYEKFRKGVNFAFAGSAALGLEFFKEMGVQSFTNVSLETQLGWFKEMFPHLCHSPSECDELLENALVLVGIGGNDYNIPFMGGKSNEEMRSFVPTVIAAISSAINELIEIGAVTIMVPGCLPLGCAALNMKGSPMASPTEDYDPETGCLISFNELAEYHNEMLQTELNRIKEAHPHATITYADYYNSAMDLYRNPVKYGFSTQGAREACCSGSLGCGSPSSTACDDPASYISWDGVHLTEAAYSWMSKGLLQGPYTIPPMNTTCLSVSAHRTIYDMNSWYINVLICSVSLLLIKRFVSW